VTLTLTGEEQEFLVQTLKSYLSDLRPEISRTDNPQFKARLKHEAEIVQRLIEKLQSA